MASNEEFTPSPLRAPIVHITSHNAAGQASIISSKEGYTTEYPKHRFQSTTLYTTSSLPVNLNDDVDVKIHEELMATGELGVVRPNGTVCRIVDFAPGSVGFMHRTVSLDYGIVLEGEVIMELDDGSQTTMKSSDTVVQRATMHLWRNPSETQWARVLFVLQDCQHPLLVNGQPFKEDLHDAAGTLPSSGNDVE